MEIDAKAFLEELTAVLRKHLGSGKAPETAKDQPAQEFTKQANSKTWSGEQTQHFMKTGETPNDAEFRKRNSEWRRKYGL